MAEKKRKKGVDIDPYEHFDLSNILANIEYAVMLTELKKKWI
jgi:hypothetical protein